MIRYKFFRFIMIILSLLFLPDVSSTYANEILRINGMGGAYAGIYNAESSIFGNPAGLINVAGNNLSFALIAQDMDYESLPATEDEQLNMRLSFRIKPSVYYTGSMGKFGISLGYIEDIDNRSTGFKIEKTEAEYIIDERKFTSDTDTAMEYDFLREKMVVLSAGYPINPQISVGMRLKYRNQVVKDGVIYRPLRLTAVHDEDVNRNDATKLIPAIIDNLDIEEAIERYKSGEDSREEAITDLSGSGMDMDLGVQAKLPMPGNITVGFVLDHLIQRKVVEHNHSIIRLGIGLRPTNWFIAAFDLEKTLRDSGLNINLGWEINHRWKLPFSGGITVRNGFSSDSEKDKLSIGIGLILGGSHWDYTMVKALDGSPISKATHMFSSATRF
jgi:hypothetical protein